MRLGWVDFSKDDKKRALDLLDSIYESGTLDELGLAPIRDGFSNLFFQGITTIQTKAKYFLIVPYALKEIYDRKIIDYNSALLELYRIENQCCYKMAQDYKLGVIGISNTSNNRKNDPNWIKRKPSEIYWTGLQTYDIFKSNTTLWNYIKITCDSIRKREQAFSNGKKYNDKTSDNRNYEDNSSDDVSPLNINNNYYLDSELCTSLYKKKWLDDLKLDLTRKEQDYLKKKIVNGKKTSKSVLSTLIKRNKIIKDKITFYDIKNYLDDNQLISYDLACKFDEFQNVLKLVYNNIVYNHKLDDKLIEELSNKDLKKISKINLNNIYNILNLNDNKYRLFRKFLDEAKVLLKEIDTKNLLKSEPFKKLENLIKAREISLKGERAKTKHPIEFDNPSFGNYHFDYRFDNAKIIINDILKDGEGNA